MLLAFAEKTLSGLVFSALVVGIATYFGQALVFDPIILIAFIAIALVFRRNIDLVSICCIFIAERALEELMWRFMEYTLWFKVPAYLIFFCIAVLMSSGILRTFAVFIFTAGISIELYWELTDYKAPAVLWLFYFLTINIVVRKFLRMRTFWLIEVNPKLEPRPLALDSQLLLANIGFILLNSANIIEYWIRHLTPYNNMLVFYNSFSHLSHALSVFMLYMIIVQSIQHLRELELSA